VGVKASTLLDSGAFGFLFLHFHGNLFEAPFLSVANGQKNLNKFMDQQFYFWVGALLSLNT
jgi:hypothetical protein